MGGSIRIWWDRLRVRQKVWTVVLVLCVPLISALTIHFTLIHQLRQVQQQYSHLLLARDQIHILTGLAVDIEDGFRGYLLTEQEVFLEPMREAEARLVPTVAETVELVKGLPGPAAKIQEVNQRFNDLLVSKRELIKRVQAGQAREVVQYVRTGKGLVLSNALRHDLHDLEDRLTDQLDGFRDKEEFLATRAFWGLGMAVAGGVALGLFSANLLTRSITDPLRVLRGAVAASRDYQEGGTNIPIHSADEIGELARSYEEMADSVQRHLLELETLVTLGNEINTIGPDGLDGVLWRITERAAQMLRADVCLVMLRDEVMGCWVVEAASEPWQEKLRKTVMLWEEFPIAVRSFETGQVAIGENLRSDSRPEVVRRSLIGESILAVPLLFKGDPFGVLLLLMERSMPAGEWNVRLAKGFADEAAIAIANARLYEEAKQKGKGLASRLRQLEQLAETLAHDMKGPGERMEGLSAMLLSKYEKTLDPEAVRLLALIQESGKVLTARIETILDVSRLETGLEAVEAVDPSLIIGEVLKGRAGELEAGKIRIHLTPFPMVACHRAYLHQVFDNLISNAIKFSGNRADPQITIGAERAGDRVLFKVADNGAGIPPQHRERVFDPFCRLQPQTKGSGIGLTIVKRIVELHGGQVWIEADGQAGCTVAFTLPALGDLNASGPSGI